MSVIRKSSKGNPYHDEKGRFCSGPKGNAKYTVSEKTAEEYEQQTKARIDAAKIASDKSNEQFYKDHPDIDPIPKAIRESEEYIKCKKQNMEMYKDDEDAKPKGMMCVETEGKMERTFSASSISDARKKAKAYAEKMHFDDVADLKVSVDDIDHSEDGEFVAKYKVTGALVMPVTDPDTYDPAEAYDHINTSMSFWFADMPEVVGLAYDDADMNDVDMTSGDIIGFEPIYW